MAFPGCGLVPGEGRIVVLRTAVARSVPFRQAELQGARIGEVDGLQENHRGESNADDGQKPFGKQKDGLQQSPGFSPFRSLASRGEDVAEFRNLVFWMGYLGTFEESGALLSMGSTMAIGSSDGATGGKDAFAAWWRDRRFSPKGRDFKAASRGWERPHVKRTATLFRDVMDAAGLDGWQLPAERIRGRGRLMNLWSGRRMRFPCVGIAGTRPPAR